MRRVIVILAVAAMIVALSVSPAFAAPNPPDQADPGLRKANCNALGTPAFAKIPNPSVPPICVVPP
jgi:hypothetical protein